MELKSLAKKYEYAVNVSGNLELPLTEQVTVEIIRPTKQEASTIKHYVYNPITGNTRWVIDYNYALTHNVGTIKNLKIGRKEIKSGKDLIDTVEANELIDDIVGEVLLSRTGE